MNVEIAHAHDLGQDRKRPHGGRQRFRASRGQRPASTNLSTESEGDISETSRC